MNPLAGRRIAAYALDCVGYLGIAAATVPVGIWLNSAGIVGQTEESVRVASVVPVIAATLVAARAESVQGATWGKRRLGLDVRAEDGGTVPFSRALARNVVKIGVPWHLGHLTAIGAMWGAFDRLDPLVITSSAVVYAFVGVGVWGLVRGNGRGVHDLVAGTRVGRVTRDVVPTAAGTAEPVG